MIISNGTQIQQMPRRSSTTAAAQKGHPSCAAANVLDMSEVAPAKSAQRSCDTINP
ncbi:MAG: hypothetical protein IJA83_09105 [Clostridia bacterium]|nr:hypothetical protein [Clostridia bacterium]